MEDHLKFLKYVTNNVIFDIHIYIDILSIRKSIPIIYGLL